MANKHMYQLLITATAKKDTGYTTFGYGLPYPIPIVNPVWVSMDKVIAAQAYGKLDIFVHNVEPPVLLTKELYSKFIEMGYIDKDITDSIENLDKASEDSKELTPSHPKKPAGSEDDEGSEIEPPEGGGENFVTTVKSIKESDKNFSKLENVEEFQYEHDATEIVFGVEMKNITKNIKKDHVTVEVEDMGSSEKINATLLTSKIISSEKTFVGAYKVISNSMDFGIKVKAHGVTKGPFYIHKLK